MVTVETAIALVGLAVVVAFAGFALTVGVAQIRCVDAARDAARAAARGVSDAASRQIALRSAPPGASVSIEHAGDRIDVSVQARVAAPGVLARMGAIGLRAESTVDAEPGVGTANAGGAGG
jgi:hypothetical protein